MKSYNLLESLGCVDDTKFKEYEKNLSQRSKSILWKPHEINSLKRLIGLLKAKENDLNLQDYFLSYTIPHLEIEFDLLKITDKACLNIELKSEMPKNGTEEIKNQLINHSKYLNLLEKENFLYTVLTNTGQCFKLNEANDLEKTNIDEVIRTIFTQFNGEGYKTSTSLFSDELILVSPLNTPSK